jgi:hypothetical protein
MMTSTVFLTSTLEKKWSYMDEYIRSQTVINKQEFSLTELEFMYLIPSVYHLILILYSEKR